MRRQVWESSIWNATLQGLRTPHAVEQGACVFAEALRSQDSTGRFESKAVCRMLSAGRDLRRKIRIVFGGG
jgi:hypothetical protein